MSHLLGIMCGHGPPRPLPRGVARTQHGLVARAHVLALGGSDGLIRHRLDRGRWERVHPNVYRIAGAPRTREQALLAAVMAAGDRSAVSHRAAAALWRLPYVGGGAVEVVVPRPRHPRLAGVVVHQARVIEPADLDVVDDIWVTSPARTLVDVAGVVSRARLALALDDALARRLTTLDAVAGTVERLGAGGRAGGRVVRRLLAERDPAQAPPDSVLEGRLLALLRRAGLEAPACQYPVWHEGRVVASIDVAYPHLLVGIEAYGWGAHGGREAFEADRRRSNVLASLGWVLLRVTWRQVVHQPEAVVAMVRAALRTARRTRSAPSTAT
jgi:hypothetical protein